MTPSTVLVFIIGLTLSTLFSVLNLTLSDLSRTGLEELAERKRAGRRRKAAIAAINADVDGHARAAALARILCNLVLVVDAAKLISVIRGEPGLDWIDAAVAVVVTGLLVWLFNVVFAESMARTLEERLVYRFTPLARLVYLLQRPTAPISTIVDSMVRALTGAKPVDKAEELEQELMDVVEEGEREGQIDEVERDMIEAVVNFKSRTVEQIMTPRNEIEALKLTNNLGEITAFVRKARHSRIPVYKESLDDIVGFFYVKDLLRWLAGEGPRAKNGGFDLRAILRPAMLVPESKTIRDLAEEFVARKIHVAVVADEYGGTSGIVSLEDIVEEVFGEIQDEYEKPEDDAPRIEVYLEEQRADIDARAYIKDVNEALEPLGVDLPESDEYDTLGGFVLSTLGRMPEQNESFTIEPSPEREHAGRTIVTVLEATPTRVVRVRIVQRRDAAGDDRSEAAVVTPERASEAERVG